MSDRVAALLSAEGLENVLLDLGEVRGWGRHRQGRPWRAAVLDAFAPARGYLAGTDGRITKLGVS